MLWGGQKKDHIQTTKLKLTNNQVADYCGNVPFANEICDVCQGSGASGDGTCPSCKGLGDKC